MTLRIGSITLRQNRLDSFEECAHRLTQTEADILVVAGFRTGMEGLRLRSTLDRLGLIYQTPCDTDPHEKALILAARCPFLEIALPPANAGHGNNFRQVSMLSPEVAWVNHFRGKRKRFWRSSRGKPRLLAALAKALGQQNNELISLSPLSLRSLLDSVRLRLDELRDVSRYMIGLLIFLGLLGTFWGLLITVSAIGDMISGLSGAGAETGGSPGRQVGHSRDRKGPRNVCRIDGSLRRPGCPRRDPSDGGC